MEITAARKNIHQEEVEYLAAVSEATFTKMGGSVNFINENQHLGKTFNVNGPYSISLAMPVLGIDGIIPVYKNIEIVDVALSNVTAGTSGTLEMDVKRATSSGGAFVSIFSTTPKITSAAPSGAYVGSTLGGGVGQTAPVFSTTNIDDGDALRVDLLSVMTGGENASITIYFRPR